jgi:hypothetical protein
MVYGLRILGKPHNRYKLYAIFNIIFVISMFFFRNFKYFPIKK